MAPESNQLAAHLTLLQFLFQYLTPERKAALQAAADMRTRHFTVVLEDIYHPHNNSAILRSCDCFGIQDVHIVENRHSWDHHYRVERGSAQWLNVFRHNTLEHNTAGCIDLLHKQGYQIAAATPHAAHTIDDIPIDKPIAFIFGAEKRGVSQVALEMAEVSYKIPMYGFTESFNVSVAAAITLHAMRRRLITEKIAWQLTDVEKDELFLEWTKNSLKHHDKLVRAFQKLKSEA